jgi:choloylglycine hydrolase
MTIKKNISMLLIASAIGSVSIEQSMACSRVMYSGPSNVVVTGRSMDWMEDMSANLWALPKGISNTGAAGPNSITWTSKYGSVVTTAYDIAAADGMNEKGLVANLLYLSKAQYGQVGNKPTLSSLMWAQYALDNFATVDEAVQALKSEPFRIVAPVLPNGSASTLHLSLSDASGDSAIFEYLDGKLVIHHGKQYQVMTNDPSYDKQLAINSYWKDVGGVNFLPGTISPSDRFARGSYMLSAMPNTVLKRFSSALPTKNLETQSSLSMLGIMRSISVPLGESVTGKPDVASTLWRSVADQKSRIYYFDSALSPNAMWVDLKKLDLSQGSPVKKLTTAGGKIYAGETSQLFEPAKIFKPMDVKPY